ncbi:MAG: DUF5107 domain-containing protein [Anaerolineae bacterium]|nr:DUF5107 domain-containing protein [Anaerolineae bacterium]
MERRLYAVAIALTVAAAAVLLAACGFTTSSPAHSPLANLSPATPTRRPGSAAISSVTLPTDTPARRPTDTPGVQSSPSPTPLATERPADRPTATLTLPPAPSPTVQPVNPPLSGRSSHVSVWEEDLTLHTYDWLSALVPTTPDDPIYPYPRLNFDAVGPAAPRTYRAVVIQNEYVQLVVVPELGGRILRWTDRTTGRQLLYNNPVIKPTRWGYRGWWLAIGGIEWAFPVEEHGLNEYRPWRYWLLRNGVRVGDTDDRTGLSIEVEITLDPGRSDFILSPRISNPTTSPQTYQFWANAMLVLSDNNTPSPGLVFVLPDDAVTVHSTGDAGLPGPGGQMGWPIHNGRDFSRYSEWRHYLGLFADPAQAGFVGAYDTGSDQGIARIFPHTLATGVKIFCPGDLPSSLWTDDNSRYVELWGGLTPTFWSYLTLAPGATVAWTERWYPVSGIGGYNWANAEAAIRLLPMGDQAELAVATTRALDGSVVLRRGGVEVQRWETSIAPGSPFRATGGPASSGDWGVQLFAEGTLIAQMGP